MARLPPLPPETTPELKPHFDFFLGTLGFTPNSVLTMQRKPKLAQALAVLTVADSGPGVPEEAQASIFNAFVSQKEGGMGMGLAICRSIVEAHHGRIDVIRDPDLGGARFVIWLPLTTPPANASSQPDAATPRT